jgi:hypothetical protein
MFRANVSQGRLDNDHREDAALQVTFCIDPGAGYECAIFRFPTDTATSPYVIVTDEIKKRFPAQYAAFKGTLR